MALFGARAHAVWELSFPKYALVSKETDLVLLDKFEHAIAGDIVDFPSSVKDGKDFWKSSDRIERLPSRLHIHPSSLPSVQ
jgi:hypothetical protein